MSLGTAWQDPAIPIRQLAIVEKELEIFRSGGIVAPFTTLTKILSALPRGLSLLEIGASSAFNSEVLRIAGLDFRYEACDYSRAFKELAAVLYPGIPFTVADACDLPYPDEEFDVILSGGCLMHIEDYAQAMPETARVSSRYALFHRTPILSRGKTVTFTKTAYGVEMPETHFNKAEFETLLKLCGLKRIAELPVFWDATKGFGHIDYLTEKS